MINLYQAPYIAYVFGRNDIDKPLAIMHNIYFKKIFKGTGGLCYHRKNLPAVIDKRTYRWYRHGEEHNLHGPSFMRDGLGVEYRINGVRYTEEDYLKYIREQQ